MFRKQRPARYLTPCAVRFAKPVTSTIRGRFQDRFLTQKQSVFRELSVDRFPFQPAARHHRVELLLSALAAATELLRVSSLSQRPIQASSESRLRLRSRLSVFSDWPRFNNVMLLRYPGCYESESGASSTPSVRCWLNFQTFTILHICFTHLNARISYITTEALVAVADLPTETGQGKERPG